jgi:ABC-type branched-subunit amino acid transport system ATPase component/predicted MFS family arabinose efflux permease
VSRDRGLPPLRELLARPDGPSLRRIGRQAGWYPLVALTLLNLVDELDRAVMAVMAPNIRRTFDISNAQLGLIVGLQVAAVLLLAVPIGYIGVRFDRSRLLRWSAAVWGAFSMATAAVAKLPWFVATRIGTGVGKASVDPVGKSLLTDTYPSTAWGRVLAVHGSANSLGGVVGPLMAGAVGVAVAGDGVWRWAMVVLTVPTFVALVLARRLREPPASAVRSYAGTRASEAEADTDTHAVKHQSFRRSLRRVTNIPTFQRQIVGIGVLGFSLVGVAVFGSILYEDAYGVGEGGRGVIAAILATGGFLGTAVGGRVGERIFAADPRAAVRLVGLAIAAFGVVIGIGVYMPWVWLMVAVLWVAVFAGSIAVSPLNVALGAISPPHLRPLMFSMLGLYVALFGGVGGSLLVGLIADAAGIRAGMVSLLPFGLIGGLVMASGASTVEDDMAAVERELRDDEARRARRSRPDGTTALALEVAGVDFAYGTVPILAGVDLTVPEGEIAALLGTNGAGKSTLLRVVAGLETAQRGRVRLFDADVTELLASERVGLGMSLVAGGKATFPSLTVEENLRVGGWQTRRDRAGVARRVDGVLDRFPELVPLLDDQAGTLSGGLQQMLALGRSLVSQPRLLLVDELSLGLAPAVVERLLGVVRELHAGGTTVVVVEQSVNVALALAGTAHVLERGAVRYSGPAADLADRDDLLRAVFLGGAAASNRAPSLLGTGTGVSS